MVVLMGRWNFSLMAIPTLCYLILCLSLILKLSPVHSQPIWLASQLSRPEAHDVDQPRPEQEAVQFAKRSLASGRWGLRPGKRSAPTISPLTALNSYDFETGEYDISDLRYHPVLVYI